MKKTALTAILLALTVSVLQAQTAYDALMLSENDYEGTARTVAMGNAFTALGGDLGAVSINPAGSAVAKYSQFTVTPGLSISTCNSSGVSPYQNGELQYFERSYRSTRTGFSFPNAGFSLNFNTGSQHGIKNVSVGFIINQTASYNNDAYARGHNSTTSFAGQLAYEASVNGYTGLDLEDAYDNPALPWKAVTGFRSGMFEGFEDIYVAATEKVYDDKSAFVAGELEQTYGRNITGGKYEYLFNAGMNISDFIYVGANIGINSISYSYDEYFKEKAVNIDDFRIDYEDADGNPVGTSYFDNLKYKSGYSFDGTGIFAKLGIIVTPFSWLRVGAAIKTPTIMTINESWEEEGETTFIIDQKSKSYSSLSPYGENKWSFRTPLEANFGAAVTFGKLGLISLDYELSNYGNIRYNSSTYTDDDVLDYINEDIANAYGISHNLRFGGEFKPFSFLAIRAGYGLKTSAEKAVWNDIENNWVRVNPEYTHKASFGLGFSTSGSFFADIACSSTFLPKEYFMPYADYVYVTQTDGSKTVDPNYYAPEILFKSNLWKVVLTLGFRF